MESLGFIFLTIFLYYNDIPLLDCSTDAPLLVNSSFFTFKSHGNFYCNNSGTLVYSNGTKLKSSQTTCLASAQWDGQEGLECWKGYY